MAGQPVRLIITAKNMMGSALKRAGASITAFGRATKRIFVGVTKAALVATTAVVAFSAKMLAAYSKQETAEQSLIAARRAAGDAMADNIDLHKELAARIQNETGAADEQTLAQMAQLRTMGVNNEKMEEAIKLTMALEKVGMRGRTAIRAAADAIHGSTTALTAYIPALRGAKTEAEKLAIVQDLARRGYEQEREELDTVAGRWKELKGRVGDFMEVIGKAIANSGSVANIMGKLSDKIKAVGQAVAGWIEQGGVDRFIGRIKKLGSTFAEQKIHIAVGLITIAVIGLSSKLLILSKRFDVLATKMTAAKGAELAKAAGLKLLSLKASGATEKVIALKAATIALKGVGVGAIAVGFVAIAKAALDAYEAARKLAKSMENLKGTEAGAREKFGAGSRSLRKIRVAIQTGDTESLEKLRKLYPEAVANAERLLAVQKQSTQEVNKTADAIAQQAQQSELTAKKIDEAKEKAAKDAAAAEKKAAEQKLEWQNKIAENKKELDDAERQRQDLLAAQNADNFRAQIEANQRVAGMRVAQFIDEKKEQKEVDKQLAKEAERRDELLKRRARGTKLSKRDRAFLEAQDAIAAAKDAVKVGKDNLLQMQLAEQKKQFAKLDGIEKEIKEENVKLNKLLAAG